MKQIMASKAWTQPQRQWLERIGKQFKENTLVDRESIDEGQFKEYGGYVRLNKVFEGKLGELLGEITDQIWGVAA
jgi:type I restriction enzyme R subunit